MEPSVLDLEGWDQGVPLVGMLDDPSTLLYGLKDVNYSKSITAVWIFVKTSSKAPLSQPYLQWLDQLTRLYKDIECSSSKTKVEAETPVMICQKREF